MVYKNLNNTKVIYVAPIVADRFKGGIMRIGEILSSEQSLSDFREEHINLELFNSCIVKQKKESQGKFDFTNIKQAIFLLFYLSKRILKNNFDVVHFNSSAKFPLLKDQLILFFITFLTSKKVYLQIHFSGIEETFLKLKLLRKFQFFLLRRLHKIILLSENFRNELILTGIAEEKLTVLHNFHSVSDQENSISLDCGTKLKLLFVGSISERKGFNDLLKAINNLKIDYELNVLGEFSSEEIEVWIKSFISINKLKVNFLGYLNGIKKDIIIKNSDVLILPSYAEGFPMVIPEAMAFGCAIISTKIAGIPEIIKEGFNGYLINPGEIDELSKRIEKLYFNRNILKEIKNINLKLSTKYNRKGYIVKLSNIYKI